MQLVDKSGCQTQAPSAEGKSSEITNPFDILSQTPGMISAAALHNRNTSAESPSSNHCLSKDSVIKKTIQFDATDNIDQKLMINDDKICYQQLSAAASSLALLGASGLHDFSQIKKISTNSNLENHRSDTQNSESNLLCSSTNDFGDTSPMRQFGKLDENFNKKLTQNDKGLIASDLEHCKSCVTHESSKCETSNYKNLVAENCIDWKLDVSKSSSSESCTLGQKLNQAIELASRSEGNHEDGTRSLSTTTCSIQLCSNSLYQLPAYQELHLNPNQDFWQKMPFRVIPQSC